MSNSEFKCQSYLHIKVHMLYFKRCVCSIIKNPTKGRMIMHHNVLTDNKKAFYSKVLFFILLFVLSLLMYIESKLIIDAFYSLVILILFIRFLVVKLYQ